MYASAAYAAAEALCCRLVRPVIPLSVPVYAPCHRYFFCFARILHEFRSNLREVVITNNRLNNHVLGEIVTGTREHDTTENLNRRQSVLRPRQTGADA